MRLRIKDKRLPSEKSSVKQNKMVNTRGKYHFYKKISTLLLILNVISLIVIYKLTTI
jgi:hypothetical protein